jgi:hypothetical protein
MYQDLVSINFINEKVAIKKKCKLFCITEAQNCYTYNKATKLCFINLCKFYKLYGSWYFFYSTLIDNEFVIVKCV